MPGTGISHQSFQSWDKPAAPSASQHLPTAAPPPRRSIGKYFVVGGGLLVLVLFLANKENAQRPSSSSTYQSASTSAPVLRSSEASRPSSSYPIVDLSRGGAAGAEANRPLTPEEVREAQILLTALGLNAGTADGLVGPNTIAAVKRYEATRGWSLSGAVDLRLLEYLRAGKGSSAAGGQSAPAAVPKTESPRPVDTTSADVALAVRTISQAEHPCPTVLTAVRLSDGSLRASCSNGEIYRIMSVRGEWIAMKCSAALRQGVDGC